MGLEQTFNLRKCIDDLQLNKKNLVAFGHQPEYEL